MSKARKTSITPNVTFLGAGAVYFNWGLEDEVYVGQTKGGSEFTDNAEYRQSDHDGNYFPSVGEQFIVSMMPQLTINSITLSKDNLLKFYSGMKEDNTVPGKTRLRRTFNLCNSYIKNVAFVGTTASNCGTSEKFILVVLENVLGTEAFNIPATAKEEEIVISPTLTAHVDPNTFDFDDETTYPFYIEYITTEVTFNIDDGTTPVDEANIVMNVTSYGQTDLTGSEVMYVEQGRNIGYKITKDGYETVTSAIDLDSDVAEINVTLTAAP